MPMSRELHSCTVAQFHVSLACEARLVCLLIGCLQHGVVDVALTIDKILTIDNILERGEKLDDLVARSDELSATSKQFYKQARKTNSCCVIA